jgi:hypothetical protein
VQFIDRVFFHPGGFATPAQTAKIQWLEEKIFKAEDENDIDELKDKIKKLLKEIADIQTDEITNNILRTAPIRGDPTSLTRLKVVIMCERDYQKLDFRIMKLTNSMCINNEQDPTIFLEALDSIHHPVVAVDSNPDRPSPIPIPAPTSQANLTEQLLSLLEQQKRLVDFMDFRASCINRDAIPYPKVANKIARHPGLLRGKRMTKSAIVKYLLSKNGTHIAERTIKDCVTLALVDRIIIDEISDGETYIKLHANTIAYMTATPNTGPDYPKALSILDPLDTRK